MHSVLENFWKSVTVSLLFILEIVGRGRKKSARCKVLFITRSVSGYFSDWSIFDYPITFPKPIPHISKRSFDYITRTIPIILEEDFTPINKVYLISNVCDFDRQLLMREINFCTNFDVHNRDSIVGLVGPVKQQRPPQRNNDETLRRPPASEESGNFLEQIHRAIDQLAAEAADRGLELHLVAPAVDLHDLDFLAPQILGVGLRVELHDGPPPDRADCLGCDLVFAVADSSQKSVEMVVVKAGVNVVDGCCHVKSVGRSKGQGKDRFKLLGGLCVVIGCQIARFLARKPRLKRFWLARCDSGKLQEL